MSLNAVVEPDAVWPSIGTDAIGIHDGVMVPPDTIDRPQELTFQSSHTFITPGWFNSHAHLELSGADEIRYDGNFYGWLMDVLEFKNSLENIEITEDFKKGCRQLIESGVASVIDHCDRTDIVSDVLDDVSINVSLFKEMVAFEEDAVDEVKNSVSDFLETVGGRDNGRHGLAPHAPYSAHPELYRWAQDQLPAGATTSSHLHEIEAELELAETSSGPLMDLLRERSGSEVNPPFNGVHPIPYLMRGEYLKNPMFGVHLNYLNEEDYRWLEASPITPVFCPKSYTFFGHGTVPVKEWHRRSIDFALGTDSLASNDSLDMLMELRRLAELASDIPPETVLEALTVNPARTLGVPGRAELTWGTPADLSIFDVPSGDLKDLARGRAEPLAVIVDGELTLLTDQ